MDALDRTRRLLGECAMEALASAHVAVFGLGGVGGHVAEALARTGVGALTLVDADRVELTNLNRQILATCETLGQEKALAARERVAQVAPGCQVDARVCFFDESTQGEFDFGRYSYLVDAIDSVPSKLLLAQCAQRAGVPLISCMGAGNKLDPTRFEVADITQTSVCPLARIMRRELRKRGIEHLKVVYSREQPAAPPPDADGRRTPGSVAFVPAVAGLILAGEVVRDLTGAPR